MKADFQHTAYTEAHAALQAARKAGTTRLAEAFPNADGECLLPAIDQALRLCQEAARVVPQMQQSHGKDKMLAELRRRCPGYSEGTYEAATVDAITDYVR
jgi:hypothetical protein